MVFRNTSSKKICAYLGCRWLNFKSKKNIPLEQSIKRMLVKKGGSLPEDKVKELKEIIEYIQRNGYDEKVRRRIKRLEKFLRF